MPKLTFDNVCKQLKKEAPFQDILDGLDILATGALFFMGLQNPTADSIGNFANVLAVKDQLKEIGAIVLNKLLDCKTDEYSERMKVVKQAYAMIYYTAFFDVLDEELPRDIRESLSLSTKEKNAIFADVSGQVAIKLTKTKNTEIFFPKMTYGYEEVIENLRQFYLGMAEELFRFFRMLSFEEKANEVTIGKLYDIVDRLPDLAVERFEEQYWYLASNFNEFYVYTELEAKRIEKQRCDERYREVIALLNRPNTQIDVGLDKLDGILYHVSEKIKEGKVQDIVCNLIHTYKEQIEEPIINDDTFLRYPSIGTAFIPQSFQLLKYTGKERLEEKETWKDRDENQDMSSFWIKYFVALDNVENILLVLGEPGGGKSLLTKILCARMISDTNVLIRIPLREVDVEKKIEEIVCEQLEHDGDASEKIERFKWFAENFKQNPITLVFDGYDEVLQSTGNVYKRLLENIAAFQKECTRYGRSIRVIVTSRATLIDRADIPNGTLVMKLLEFNEEQRDRWIQLWNECNKDIFKENGIAPFMMPVSNNSIEELSRQPLLLLMLAIYDANIEEKVNSLKEKSGLNRTKLYNELLRRFIRRELKKGGRGEEIPFDELEEEDQEQVIDDEMEKLGIIAVSMFNRGKLSLKKEELQKDLEYMEAIIPKYEEKGKMMSHAELLFGSFFFIHASKSSAKIKEETEEAFEFLHKTFYEFLIIYLILKYLMEAIWDLNALRKGSSPRNYKSTLENANYLNKKYYMPLIHTCLCAEAESFRMLTEWKEYVLKENFKNQIDYMDTIKELFEYQVQSLCHDAIFPDCWKDKYSTEISHKKQLEYCATYLLNFLILKTVTLQENIVQVEYTDIGKKRISINKKEWKYIAQFIKLNVHEDIILKFSSMFDILCVDDEIFLYYNILNIEREQDKLENQLDIFEYLQDEITYNIYMLHINTDIDNKQRSREFLLGNGIPIEIEHMIASIQEAILKGESVRKVVAQQIKSLITIIEKKSITEEQILEWLILVNSCLTDEEREIHPKHWIRLIYICNQKYAGNLAINFELIKLKIKMKLYDIKFGDEADVLWIMMPNWLCTQAEQTIEFLTLCCKENVFSHKRLADITIEVFDTLYAEFPSEAVKLLELCAEEDEIRSLIKKLLDEYEPFDINREFATVLRLLCLGRNQGEMEKVKLVLKRVEENIAIEEQEPIQMLELLELAYSLDETLLEQCRILEYCVCNVVKGLENEKMYVVRLLHMLSLEKGEVEKERMMNFLIDSHQQIFYVSPQSAVQILKYCEKNNNRYYHILTKTLIKADEVKKDSIQAALDLYDLANEKNSGRIQSCFDYMLYRANPYDVDQNSICAFMDTLKEDTLKILEPYFRSTLNLFRLKYPHISEKLIHIYA